MNAVPAAVIESLGAPPRVVDRDIAEPAADELVVAVRAAPITPLDLLCASGTSYFGRPATPYVPGVQGVGVVERGNGQIAPGTSVWFATSAGMRPGDGSMRARVPVHERDVVPLPDGADPVLVAALGLSAVAAWMALTWRGELAAGEQVLVLGAGGVVGQVGVQLARAGGAGRVVAAARSARSREQALRLGADAVVALEASDTVDDLAERMSSACDGPVDLVLDPLFGVPAAAAVRTLRTGGRLVNLGSSAAETAPIDSSTLRSRLVQVIGYTNNALTPQQRSDALNRVVAEAVAGNVTVAHEQMPLAHAAQAWTRQAEGRATGRIVLTP
ncbi:quinone oxidoreductase family protein [Pseudonocardia alaniniphila]|uniref:Zinc-binding alcohol dehydrogenase family protein n=1 Tax=Pseudonocardia alaniniphila TaxID=75291 RepID=A0ABS9TNA4_9PSEU|nr:zinc-binding alcohol dehydrogenase family protein [Pseudonocardia alaniniphila]MCH6170020.1 zinc-binding alcohol dehydrogenase family protein [Pseudonocardia alaniniphila]